MPKILQKNSGKIEMPTQAVEKSCVILRKYPQMPKIIPCGLFGVEKRKGEPNPPANGMYFVARI